MNTKELIDLVEENFDRRYWGYLEDFSEYYEGDTYSEKLPQYDDFRVDGKVDYTALREERGRVEKIILEKLNLGEFVQVDQYGGEGDGSTFYSIVHFKDHDIYLRWDGWYASYDGWYLESPPTEVKPKTKQITVFE